MSGINVSHISIGAIDSAGSVITSVYSKLVPHFAVYRTEERVMVQFSDDAAEDLAQRKLLTPVNPLRGQVTGLINGWRVSKAHDQAAKARLFDRAVADALTLALQGEPSAAIMLLQETKDEIIEERMSWARFQYLIWACGAGFLMIALFSILSSDWFSDAIGGFSSVVRLLWSAAGLGCVGAFFSIALGVRTRELRTDLQSSDNAADAVLRVVIGATAAAILVALLASGIASLKIGDAEFASRNLGGDSYWPQLVVIAFLAGFSERLVPNLLEKAVLTGMAAQRTTPPVAPDGGGGAAGAAGPSGGTPPPAAAPIGGQPAVADPADEECDGCVAGSEVTADDDTDDTELPPATGGVEGPPSTAPQQP